MTTGCQRRPASGCADVDRDRDISTVYGGEHALPADVTIGTADPVCLNGEKWRAASSLDFPIKFGNLSQLLSPSCRNPSLVCAAQPKGIGGSSFLPRKMRLFISFHLCLHFTQVSQMKALHSRLRFHVLKMLGSFQFRASNRPSTHSHPACCQDSDVDIENNIVNWYAHGHVENYWCIASPNDQHIIGLIGSPVDILPVQKHKNN